MPDVRFERTSIISTLRLKGETAPFIFNSPDFNPIELSWSKMKSILRKLKPRTYDELELSLKIALESFTNSDVLGRFNHDGYDVNV